jgi:quercetin dioxygenase-like cupin family protein
MKQNIFSFFTATFISIFILACNDSATDTESNTTDTTTATGTNTDTSMPVYDAAKDPLTVEAQFAKKLADTLNIKMYEITLKPGDSAMLHTHPDYTLYVLEGGQLAITTDRAGRQEVQLQRGMGLVSPSQSHSAKNVGKSTVRLLVHDIYRPRGNR